jgi:hypothetical protein
MYKPKKAYLVGCGYEERYLQAELASAAGVLDYRKRTPGSYSTTAWLNGYNPNQGFIQLVDVGADLADIAGALINRDHGVAHPTILLERNFKRRLDTYHHADFQRCHWLFCHFATYGTQA